jgi:hypothetical protein
MLNAEEEPSKGPQRARTPPAHTEKWKVGNLVVELLLPSSPSVKFYY